MVNNTPDSKLDETVKNTLNNYEATYEPGDWSRMENMLDAAPKSSNFQWSYAVKVVGALAVIAVGYFIYNAVNTPELNKDEIISTPPIKTEEEVVKVSPDVTAPVPAPAVASPKIDQTEVANEVAKETVTPDKIAVTSPLNEKLKTEEKAVVKKEDKRKDKKQKENTDDKNVITHTLIMGNEPVFGDMLDSSKGVIGETKEKEETKKSAKAQKDLPVGWNSFMLKNVDPDSLKKHREKRDSLKNK
jgi:type IV secretory pathway VirB10-like protein